MFPQKSKWLKRPIGWENLGELNWKRINTKPWKHYFCGEILQVGRENNTLFKFCPRCMVKLT